MQRLQENAARLAEAIHDGAEETILKLYKEVKSAPPWKDDEVQTFRVRHSTWKVKINTSFAKVRQLVDFLWKLDPQQPSYNDGYLPVSISAEGVTWEHSPESWYPYAETEPETEIDPVAPWPWIDLELEVQEDVSVPPVPKLGYLDWDEEDPA